MKYRVTVIFDRLNPKTVVLEKKAIRSGEFESTSSDAAKKEYLKRFRENEPTRRKIYEVKVDSL